MYVSSIVQRVENCTDWHIMIDCKVWRSTQKRIKGVIGRCRHQYVHWSLIFRTLLISFTQIVYLLNNITITTATRYLLTKVWLEKRAAPPENHPYMPNSLSQCQTTPLCYHYPQKSQCVTKNHRYLHITMYLKLMLA